MTSKPVSSILLCSVLHCPLGLGKHLACPFPDVVFPPLFLSVFCLRIALCCTWCTMSIELYLKTNKTDLGQTDFMGRNSSVQFSSVPWLTGLLREHEGWFSRDPLPVFSAGGPYDQFWHQQGCPLFDAVHPEFPLLTMASPTHPLRHP